MSTRRGRIIFIINVKIQFNSILYSDCQIHFSASTKHVIKGHQTITNYTLNLGGFDSANWPTRM